MTEQNRNPLAGRQPEITAEFDDLLSNTLARYSAVEPRSGLEDRVLANLRVHQALEVRGTWQRWALAVAFLAIAVVSAALAWRSHKPSFPAVVNHPSIEKPTAPQSSTRAASTPRNPIHGQEHKSNRAIDSSAASSHPKLDQFPSPQPLTEQEIFLARYISENPERAALVAEARMEMLRRAHSQDSPTDSETDSRPQ